MGSFEKLADRSESRFEVQAGPRFAFGKNWNVFLQRLNDERIDHAEQSLRKMLQVTDLTGKRFLDIGSGSGLFSLAARRLGAVVRSFDYDAQSVRCTQELKDRFFRADPQWKIESGSVLDRTYLASLGEFDVVYSWGVLHHTGDMWTALANSCELVAPGGKLFIAIYNDQGRQSDFWRAVKRSYNRAPSFVRLGYALLFFMIAWLPKIVLDMAKGHPARSWQTYHRGNRGMSAWTDIVDWVGGYPFEVAKPEQIFDFCRERGFVLSRLKTCAGKLGCNEYVFSLSRKSANR